jgi:hypothetical protein
MTYVGLIQQGMVLDQKVVVVSDDEASVLQQAKNAAETINDSQTGFGEGWTAVALKVP